MKHVILTIHGVGYAAPGGNIYPMAETLAEKGLDSFERRDVVIGNKKFVILLPDPSQQDVRGHRDGNGDGRRPHVELAEANWAEVHRPPRSLLGLLGYLLKLMLGMWTVADQWKDGRDILMWPRFYRWFIHGAGIWLVLQAQVVAGCVGIVGKFGWFFFAGCILAAIGLAYGLGRALRHRYRKLAFWHAGMAFLVVLMGLLARFEAMQPVIIHISAVAYLTMQIFLAATLAGAAIHVFAVMVRTRFYAAVIRITFLYVPFLLFSALSSVVWLAVLGAVSQNHDGKLPDEWLLTFNRWLRYEAGIVESLVTAISFSMVGMAMAGTLVYFILRGWQHRLPADRYPLMPAGRYVRIHVMWSALLFAVALFVPGAVMIHGIFMSTGLEQSDLLGTYANSATRVLGMLVAILPQTVIVLDVIGDITLYAVPKEFRNISSADDAQKTLYNLLCYYDELDYHIVLVAHSLGSVVATDVLSDMEELRQRVTLFTAGSPLTTIHQPALEHCVPRLGGLKKWINVYRRGDYIGGPVDGAKMGAAVDNRCIGNGGHNGYWYDPVFLKLVTAECTDGPPPAAEPALAAAPAAADGETCEVKTGGVGDDVRRPG